MIDRIEAAWRRLRRGLSRSHWTSRLQGAPVASAQGQPGLLMVQVDGLGIEVLEEALATGRMPFVTGLLEREGYRLHRLFSGVPSTTPVMQAELFYGAKLAVPGFSFAEHESGQVVFMYERDAVRRVEARLEANRGLLRGGSAYADVYTGGAADPRFCMSSLGWGDFFRVSHPAALPALALVHAPALLAASGRLAFEGVRAAIDLRRALARGEDRASEIKFLGARLGVCLVLTEMSVLGAKVDLARGLPVVHVNLLAYDEHAHRRGPRSPGALNTLRAVDRDLARLAGAARRSGRRHYDLWIYADHGQEATRAYPEHHGRSLLEAVAEVFARHGLETGSSTAATPRGIQGQRARLLGERVLRVMAPGMAAPAPYREPGSLAVAAQGPLGHVYAPRPLTPGEQEPIARDLVRLAGVPLVLARADEKAWAWTEAGRFRLPDEAAAVLGEHHPYLDAAAEDLVSLCHHSEAGDFVVSGFRAEGPLWSFPHENGAHGGPGPRETGVFVLTPPDAPIPRSRPAQAALRALDLREAALRVLAPHSGGAHPWAGARRDHRESRLRVVTYNVHSCVGLDGHTSPERIARVLARLDADVIALQELDVERARTGGIDQAQAIAAALEMELHFLTTLRIEQERFGDAVLCKLPMRLVKRGGLPALRPRGRLEPRGAIWVEINWQGKRLQLIDTHLSLHHRERELQAEALLGPEWLAHPQCHPPRILCGDLNALPSFPVCRRLGRVLRDCQAGRSASLATFGGRWALGRIDHVFVESTLRVRSVEVPRNELTRVASDHLPLVVDLQLAAESTGRREEGASSRKTRLAGAGATR